MGNKPGDYGENGYLRATEGPYKGTRFNLQPSITMIGRIVGDVLLPDDSETAKQHAWISEEDSGWVIYDAEKSGGTFVNDEQVSRRELKSGDKIKIGGTTLEFKAPKAAANPAKAPAPVTSGAVKVEPGANIEKITATRMSPVGILVGAVVFAVAAWAFVWFAVPGISMSTLDGATNRRWDSAFAKMKDEAPEEMTWSYAAAKVISDWKEHPLGLATAYYVPSWIRGSAKINNEVDYRLRLFDLAERFFEYTSVTYGGGGITEDDYNRVASLEPMIDGCVSPLGVSKGWEDRKTQLMVTVRFWKGSMKHASGVDTGASNIPSGLDVARQYLQNGWDLYVKANGDINTEEKALSEFQLCRSSLEPSLQTAMDDPVASAVRALAGYLAAKVLCDERTPQDSSRGGTALEILDDASRYIRKATDSTWDQAIPGDLRKEFQTPASVGQKIENLRNALKGPAGPPPASSPPEEGHYRVGG